jgi:bifunctional non-homologous end joining protein LigD
MNRPSQNEAIRVGGRLVEITRPEKLLFPGDRITKREFVEYYRRIAPVMLPHLRGRPIAMERYPDGIESSGFFQKTAPSYYPGWIKTALLRKKNGVVRHVVCDDAATLVYLANQAVITPHSWLSRVDKPNNPDQMIFDLDPSDGDFRIVCAAAKGLRELLEEQRLIAYVKTTGSRGLHVLVPLDRRADFDEVRTFARQVAARLVKSDPGRLTIDVHKSKRRGRIFVDTARNAYAQTAAPAYAVRARDGAPIAVPLHWEEVDNPGLAPDQFNIRNILDRVERMHDPWKDLKQHAQKLPRRMDSDAA